MAMLPRPPLRAALAIVVAWAVEAMGADESPWQTTVEVRSDGQSLIQYGKRDSAVCPGHESAKPGRVLVLVLGHGDPERSPKLSQTLHTFADQLGEDSFDCRVFVWNLKMRLPDVPSQCEIVRQPGTFMNFLLEVPREQLQSADWIWVMTDDITLKPDAKHPVDIRALRDMANTECLDVLSPAIKHSTYALLSPQDASPAVRWVDFIEWHGQLISLQLADYLMHLSEPKITGCWGYDNLLYSAVKLWSGREPRLGVTDAMVMDVGKLGVSSFEVAEQAKYGKNHPCGKVLVTTRGVVHVAAREMQQYWKDRGLWAIDPSH